jgi:predicted house-cleaning noncanonical NTP pyrophosphatase (MazG superfamily)
MKYNKLIRDKIPEIIKSKGTVPITHIASDEEYQQKLKAKLQEEVDEFLEDNNEEELADILEVIYALCDLYKIDKDKLEQLRKDKAEKRGGFKDKIILDETKE